MDFTASAPADSDFAEISDLSKLCLPQEYKDSGRRLAWADSICVLFLVIGLIGLKPRKVEIKPLSEVMDVVPIVLTPQEETKPPEKTEQPEPPPENTPEFTPDRPVIATVVAANPSAAAFAVPVEGPVVLAPTRFAAPPPQNLKAPPTSNNKPSRITSAEEDWGGKGNQADYPAIARRNGYQGKVILELTFSSDGALINARIAKSCGYSVLDNAALEKVRKDLRLKVAPGETRVFTKEVSFELVKSP